MIIKGIIRKIWVKKSLSLYVIDVLLWLCLVPCSYWEDIYDGLCSGDLVYRRVKSVHYRWGSDRTSDSTGNYRITLTIIRLLCFACDDVLTFCCKIHVWIDVSFVTGLLWLEPCSVYIVVIRFTLIMITIVAI